jgi:hypothetical protein
MLLWKILLLKTQAIVIINDKASFAHLLQEATIFSRSCKVIWFSLRINLFSIASKTLELVFQKLFTDPQFYHNIYAFIVWELTIQNLISPGCSIGHANASFNRSIHLDFSKAALNIFPAKSTMVGIFAILDMQTLQISPYPSSFPTPGTPSTPSTCAFSGSHTTPLPMCCCMASFMACVCHNTVLILLLENLTTKSWTFCSFL